MDKKKNGGKKGRKQGCTEGGGKEGKKTEGKQVDNRKEGRNYKNR